MKIDVEPRQILYQRTGNLSETTAVNQEVAERFMHVSDLRRHIVIVDSDKKPEGNAIAVGSDVLAWRRISPLSELTRIIVRPQRFHQTELVDGYYRVQIHDFVIQDDIRQRGYQDRDDYNRQYLKRLRQEVTGAAAEVLRWEKLGWYDQKYNYVGDVVIFGMLLTYTISKGRFFPTPWDIVAYLFAHFGAEVIHSYRRLVDTPDPAVRRDLTEFWLPFVPVDKWIRGKIFLAQHGEELIIPTS